MIIFQLIWVIFFGIGLGWLIGIIQEIIINFKKKCEVTKMKSFKQKLEIFKSELTIRKKRISDESVVEIQEVINKMKTLIDDEINRRASNLNKQEGLN